MGILDRIALALYAFFLAVFSFAMVLVAAGWRRPMDLLGTSLETISGRWVTGIVSLILFLASIRFLYFGFGRRRGVQTIVHETPLGEVRVSLDAIENLIRRVARQVQGVRDVKPRVVSGPAGLSVSLKVSVSPDISIPEVSDDLQNTIKNYVRNVVGVGVTEVKTFVENITAEAKRSRVE